MTAYDVIILGGGPAGAATALALRRHNPALSVALVERGAYARPRIGETLPPGIRPLLEQLGLWSSFQQRGYVPAYGTCAAWGSDRVYANPFLFAARGDGWHLDRCDFDALLATEAAQQGVQLYTHTRLVDHTQPTPGRWRLTFCDQQNGATFNLTSAFVVDATGRLAHFAQRQGAAPVVYDQLVGLCCFFTLTTAQPETTTLIEATSEGWWYSARLPAAGLVVAYLCDRDLARQKTLRTLPQWLAQVSMTRHTQERLHKALPDSAPQVYAAHTQRLTQATGPGWLAVGDAASTFDPLSSQGIGKALRSGIWAAYAISDHLAGRPNALAKYAYLIQHEFAAYLSTWVAYYCQEQRWPTAPFWQRRQQPAAAVA
jgi:flavin-dependent dehydrogenase